MLSSDRRARWQRASPTRSRLRAYPSSARARPRRASRRARYFPKGSWRNTGYRPPRSRSSTSYEAAHAHIKELSPPYVIKADGICAGKGAYVIDRARRSGEGPEGAFYRPHPRRGRQQGDRRGFPARHRGILSCACATAPPSCPCCLPRITRRCWTTTRVLTRAAWGHIRRCLSSSADMEGTIDRPS